MPELLVFAPCDRVIVAGDNTISLITLLEEIQISTPRSKDAELPPHTLVPVKWYVFCLWRAKPGDNGRTFEQTITIKLPGDKSMKPSPVEFTFDTSTARNHRAITELIGFPIAPKGEAVIELELRDAATQGVEVSAKYLMDIQRPVE